MNKILQGTSIWWRWETTFSSFFLRSNTSLGERIWAPRHLREHVTMYRFGIQVTATGDSEEVDRLSFSSWDCWVLGLLVTVESNVTRIYQWGSGDYEYNLDKRDSSSYICGLYGVRNNTTKLIVIFNIGNNRLGFKDHMQFLQQNDKVEPKMKIYIEGT